MIVLSFIFISLHAYAPLSAKARKLKCIYTTFFLIFSNYFFVLSIIFCIFSYMKKYGVVIGALVVGAFLYFRSKAKAGGNVKVYLDGLSLDKSKGISVPNINANFKLVNPTSTPLSVDSLTGEIYYNDSLVSNVQNLSKIDIPANTEINYAIKVKTPVVSLLTSIISFFLNRKKGVKAKITFKGNINSTGVLIPIEQTIYQQ